MRWHQVIGSWFRSRSHRIISAIPGDVKSWWCLCTLNTAYTEAELDYFVDAQPQLFVGAQARAGVDCLTLDEHSGGSLMQRQEMLQEPMNGSKSR